MKYFLLLFFSVILFSCQDYEIEYPDRISMPDSTIESRGCGNIFVYQFLDELKALTVRIDANSFNLTKEVQHFNIPYPNISVVLEVSRNHPDSIYFHYCNDYGIPNKGKTIKYQATSGSLSFSVSEDNPIKEPEWQTSYFVTIRITDLHLYSQETKNEIVIDEVVFWNVHVGWLPG